MRELCFSLLLLGACASTPAVPPPPAASWTYEISHDDFGYCETIRGPEFASRAEARAALADALLANDYRGPRASVVAAN